MRKLRCIMVLFLGVMYNCYAQHSTTTTTQKKNSSKPNVEINVTKKVEINIFGDGNSTTKTKTNSSKSSNNKNESAPSTSNSSSSASSSNTLEAFGKYDFVQGEKVIALEDFEQTNLGDFPTRWNTNGSAEVVTLNIKEGKWLQLGEKTTIFPEFIKSLPENFTFEFDLACAQPFNYLTQEFFFGFVSLQKPSVDFAKWSTAKRGESGFIFGLHPSVLASKTLGRANYKIIAGSKETMKNSVQTTQFCHVSKPVVHVAVWRQGDRIRLYLNEEKTWDLPKAFVDTKFNGIVFYTGAVKTQNDKYYISNLRLAVGEPDTRNKLINDGKFSTTGILFDVNSDKIQPTSYGVLKEIANTLDENTGVKIKIVGHTDSDGDDASNMALSKKRAEAVKAFLNKEFGIDKSRMETDGKGETQSADKSNTAEGKANNRRVEFIKL